MLRKDSESVAKIATFDSHDESENIPAETTAKTLPKFSVRLDVEGRVTLRMEWAETDILPARSPQPRIARHDRKNVCVSLYFARVELKRRGKVHHETSIAALRLRSRFFSAACFASSNESNRPINLVRPSRSYTPIRSAQNTLPK
jgi:hypothetical protein